MEKITSFTGKYEFLSPYFPRQQVSMLLQRDPATDDIDDVFLSFPTVMHAYVASITVDYDEHEKIYEAKTPEELKALSKELTERPKWENKRRDLMEAILRDKFTKNFDLKLLLVKTAGKELVQDFEFCPDIDDNLFGKMLMNLRREFLEDGSFEDQLKNFFYKNDLTLIWDIVSIED